MLKTAPKVFSSLSCQLSVDPNLEFQKLQCAWDSLIRGYSRVPWKVADGLCKRLACPSALFTLLDGSCAGNVPLRRLSRTAFWTVQMIAQPRLLLFSEHLRLEKFPYHNGTMNGDVLLNYTVPES